MKNLLATMLLSLGTPMILGGDETGRTQRGNNNAYCQDNEITWHDWSLLETNANYYRFIKEMIAFRKRHPAFMRPEFFTGRDGAYNAIPDICWYTEDGETPDWNNLGNCLALRLEGSRADIHADRDDNDFFIMFNAGDKKKDFVICEPLNGKKWIRAIDTGLEPPEDFLPPGMEQPLKDLNIYTLKERSMAVFISQMLY